MGVALKVDIEEHAGVLGTRYWARVRWYDPFLGRRTGIKRSHESREEAEAWVERMHGAARTGVDAGQTLATFVEGWVSGGLVGSTRRRPTTRTTQVCGCESFPHLATFRWP